jgi:hypothetical protein
MRDGSSTGGEMRDGSSTGEPSNEEMEEMTKMMMKYIDNSFKLVD